MDSCGICAGDNVAPVMVILTALIGMGDVWYRITLLESHPIQSAGGERRGTMLVGDWETLSKIDRSILGESTEAPASAPSPMS